MKKWVRLRRDDGHIITFTFTGDVQRTGSWLALSGVPRELHNRQSLDGTLWFQLWNAPVGRHNFDVEVWTPYT